METGMEVKLEKLRAALKDLKDSGVLAKGYMAEIALVAAVDLMDEMVEEIENLKRDKEAAGKQT